MTTPALREIVLVDFEFEIPQGGRPIPVCAAAHELRSGRKFRIWQDQFGPVPPYATGPDVLFTAYYASAELGCYRVLGWPQPKRILDLFVEFRNRTNGLAVPAGNKLFGALTYFGLDTTGATEKKEMQEAIGSGTWRGRFTPEEILNYCEGDVVALQRLLSVMSSQIDWPRAQLRGRYMSAAAAMEDVGVPIDVPTLELLRENWTTIQDRLIEEIDLNYHVYEGRTFKQDLFIRLLAQHGIPWPYHESGRIDLSDSTFRHMAKAHPLISPLWELRSSLSELRLNDLAVGPDGRNRTILSAFRSRTGRNQPSNSRFIFGPAVWIRGLIKPPPGYGVAYVDYAQEEIGIAAFLSGDEAYQDAYLSTDCYITFGKQTGACHRKPPRKRMERYANFTSNACWGCNIKWVSGHLPAELDNLLSMPASYFAPTVRPTVSFGHGPTQR
jgi:hypothetical protein